MRAAVRRERPATFVTSFTAGDVAAYRIVGTRGQLHVNPAHAYAEGLACELTVNGRTAPRRIGKHDQFAPELLYFSEWCRFHVRRPNRYG